MFHDVLRAELNLGHQSSEVSRNVKKWQQPHSPHKLQLLNNTKPFSLSPAQTLYLDQTIILQDIYRQHKDFAEQPQKPLSQKQISLMFYEPPAQFHHLLALRASLQNNSSHIISSSMEPSTLKTLAHHNHRHFESLSSSTECDQTLADSSSASSMRSDDEEQSESLEKPRSDHTMRILNKKSIRRLGDIIKSIRTSTLNKQLSPTNISSDKKSPIRLDDLFKSITKNTLKMEKSSKIILLKKKDIHRQDANSEKGSLTILFPETSYYSSNHLMVNRERAMAGGLNPLHRSWILDSLAQSHAADLADTCELQVLPNLESLFGLNQVLVVGQNVQRGVNIRQMHASVMNSSGMDSRRSNILQKAFTEFGMATALGKDGKLYMVQLFRGIGVNQEDHSEKQKELQKEQEETPKEEEEEFFC